MECKEVCGVRVQHFSHLWHHRSPLPLQHLSIYYNHNFKILLIYLGQWFKGGDSQDIQPGHMPKC